MDGGEEEDNTDAEYVTPKPGGRLNDHFIVYGASGAGKSRGFVKPFILQAAKRMESLVLVDPKGELYESTSEYLRDKGYEIRAYNLLDMANSDGFNCFNDIAGDPELVKLVTEIIIMNTSNEKDRFDFWENAEKNLLSALIHYMATACDESGVLLPIERRSLGEICNMLCSVRFGRITELIEALPQGHPAKAPFDLIKDTPVQNRANIILGLGNRLGVFQNKLVDCITRYNDIDLLLPGQRPCAYYCVISDQDSSMEFLSSMFFCLLLTRLPEYARRHGNNGRLPITVNMVLDEFCNVGHLPGFLRAISTVRSRGINCQIIVQSVPQLFERYPRKEWEVIISNCDWQIFLGCNDLMTAEYVSEKCGKVTIRTDTGQMPQQPLFSPVYSSTRPYSISRSNTQRALMMPDELLGLDDGKAIVLIRGQKPLELYKVTPEELPDSTKLRDTRVTGHIPAWREKEEQRESEMKKRANTDISRPDSSAYEVPESGPPADSRSPPDRPAAPSQKPAGAPVDSGRREDAGPGRPAGSITPDGKDEVAERDKPFKPPRGKSAESVMTGLFDAQRTTKDMDRP